MDFPVNATHTPILYFRKQLACKPQEVWLRDIMSPDSIHKNIVNYYLNTLSQKVDFQMVPAFPSIPGVLPLQI